MLGRKVFAVVLAGTVVAAVSGGTNSPTLAQSAPVALKGLVSSQEEGAMEGVLISAKRAGSTITTTVVSDASGHYSFPRDRLEPGAYTIRIRAIGYELDGLATVDVTAGQAAELDVSLRKTADLSAQLSNGGSIRSTSRPESGTPSTTPWASRRIPRSSDS